MPSVRKTVPHDGGKHSLRKSGHKLTFTGL